jgi:hypothetical protein
MSENRGAEQEVTSLQQEEKPREHEKNVQGEVQLIDTSLLMGDPEPLVLIGSPQASLEDLGNSPSRPAPSLLTPSFITASAGTKG